MLLECFQQLLFVNTDSNNNYQKENHLNLNLSQQMKFWYCDITDEDLKNKENYERILYEMNEIEQKNVRRFVFLPDRQRALLSILLQRACANETFLFKNNSQYSIDRTRENKPFLRAADIGYWNYNVSHHGNIVSIISSSTHLVGLDIVDTTTRSNGIKTVEEYVEMFSPQLAKQEMQLILSGQNERDKYDIFYLIWSLKEAFIKAIGLGLGYDLSKLDFTFSSLTEPDRKLNDVPERGMARVNVSGIPRDDWRFEFQRINEDSILTIALAPLTEAIPSFQSAAWSHLPSPPSPSSSSPPQEEEDLFSSLTFKTTEELFSLAYPPSQRKRTIP